MSLFKKSVSRSDIKSLEGIYWWQRAAVGARARPQSCRTKEEYIEIFKGNALGFGQGGLEVA